jgi:hypothetical protein
VKSVRSFAHGGGGFCRGRPTCRRALPASSQGRGAFALHKAIFQLGVATYCATMPMKPQVLLVQRELEGATRSEKQKPLKQRPHPEM